MKYAEIVPGYVYTEERVITDEMVKSFAKITGDDNPIHLDDDFAAKSIFKARIAHGILTLGLVSAVLGRKFPGPGTIYLKQDATFRRPVYIGEKIQIRIEVLEKIEEKSRLLLSTDVINEKGEKALTGQALVLFREDEEE
ncbi:MAG: enoyl-CoA hydratase [Thermotogae bacterium]|uniref:MaoC family dehydratase n=1 Tax=Kosmotoga arenicorallina TaxID=688066 RepID=A0A7C5HYE3_9BACT|nr:MaoC family dehydratase [Kosmotoga sp.]MCD6159118.1 MaoC family dehydratase [Kosmotoga sp.]RKX51140.1 MAG: enoyl-CoA hydratase [Thermotogota bacterium]HHF08733.1 MaoC family dehydratase [Kosmotoga arenicorallina]